MGSFQSTVNDSLASADPDMAWKSAANEDTYWKRLVEAGTCSNSMQASKAGRGKQRDELQWAQNAAE